MSGSTSILDSLQPVGGAPPPPIAPTTADDGIPTISVSAKRGNGGGGGNTSILDSLPKVEMQAPAAPQQQQSTWRGLGRNAAAGVVQGGEGVLNTLSDPFGNLIGRPLATGIQFAHDALAPYLGYQRFSDADRAALLGDTVPQPGSRVVSAVGHAMGAPQPEDVPINGPAERLVRKGVAGATAVGTLGPAGVLAPAVGAGGAVIGDQLAEGAPGWAQPMAELAGNVAGGAAVAGGATAAQGVVRPVANMASRMGIGSKETFQGAGGEPVRATGQQAQSARGQLEAAANQSGPGGAARFEQLLTNAPEEIVPGAAPTTAQIAPLSGLAKLEDTVKATGGGPAFLERAEQQKTSRVGAITGLKPEAQPAAAGQFFRDQLAALDAQGAAEAGAARGAVGAATDALGGQGAPAAYGQEMRGAVQEAYAPLKARETKLWAAIDPDGTLAVNTAPIREAAAKLHGELTPSDTLTAGENGALTHAAGLPEVVSFRELQSLRKNIGSAARRTMAGEPLTTAGERRLAILKAAVDDALAASVEGKAAQEAHAVGSGGMMPDQTMMGRLAELGTNERAAPEGVVGGPGVRDNPDSGVRGPLPGRDNGPGQAPVVSPGAGNTNAPGRGAGLGGGNSGLSPAAADVVRKPESLTDFLIARGGIQDQGGDLGAIGADTIHHRQGGRLVNPRGLKLDYAREAAEEAGFLRPGSTINDLLDAVGGEASGRPVYRQSEQAAGVAWASMRRDAELQTVAHERASSAVQEAEANARVRMTPAELEHATQLAMRGAHPEQAVMDAMRAREETVLQNNSQMMGFGRPGVAPGASQAEMNVGKAQLTPNFDAKAAERYAVARDATLKNKERFGRGPVGEVLARGAGGAPNRVLDADVPSRFFTGRPSEPAQVQAYFKAVGGEPRGVALARDYLVSDLRRRGIIDQDGALKGDSFAKWQRDRAQTIKLFPGLADEFKTAQAAQTVLDDVQAAHATALKDYQSGAAKHFLNEEPARAVEKILGSADRVKLMQQAIGKMQGNADALESLKAHVVDYMIDRLTTSAKATEKNAAAPNLSEVGSLRADAFKDWIGDNNPWLKRLFGGQGMQTLEMVGADLRRQQTRAIATSGSASIERGVEAAKHSALRQHIPTVMALIGEKIAETGAAALGMHGLPGLMMEVVGAGGPVLVHVMRQHGIQTVNDLVREAMLHPSVARELMARPKQQAISAIAARRIAHAMQAVTVAQTATKGAEQ